jgi:hypothetical protein
MHFLCSRVGYLLWQFRLPLHDHCGKRHRRLAKMIRMESKVITSSGVS